MAVTASSWGIFMAWIDRVVAYFIESVYPRFIELLKEPFKNPDAIWLVVPLIIVLIFMQAYFGKHREEELGWNTAFGNSISLIFVGAGLLKFIYYDYGLINYRLVEIATSPVVPYKLIIVAVVLLQALCLLFLDFFHALPKRIAFFFSSPIFINTTAYLAIAIISSTTIPFEWVTLWAAALVYIVVILGSYTIRKVIRPSEEAQKYLNKLEQERKEKRLEKKRQRQQKIRKLKERIYEWLNALKLKIVNMFK